MWPGFWKITGPAGKSVWGMHWEEACPGRDGVGCALGGGVPGQGQLPSPSLSPFIHFLFASFIHLIFLYFTFLLTFLFGALVSLDLFNDSVNKQLLLRLCWINRLILIFVGSGILGIFGERKGERQVEIERGGVIF